MKIGETESNQNEIEDHKGSIKKKSTYSCYFELQLNQSDFGLSREDHNEICNRALVAQLGLLSKEGIQLVEGMLNDKILANINKSPRGSPEFFTWEHCPSATVVDGRLGVMRLVPRSQHVSRSEHWRAFHPDYRNRGGYHEWALPAGAPDGDHPKVGDKFNYDALTVEELPHYFEKTVLSNRYNDFCKVFSRAQALLTPTQIARMLSRCYPMGKSQRLNTLLHKAVKNGHQPLINSLLKCGEPVHHLLSMKNHRENTVAHNAAEHNRHLVLKELKKLGADLSLKNKRKETVDDIVSTRNFVACIPYSKPAVQSEEQHSSDEEQGGIVDSIKDPYVAYGKSGKSSGGNSNNSLKPHPLSIDKGKVALEKNRHQNTNAGKKMVITQQEIKAILKAQRALQERKNQKKLEQQFQRQQKQQRERVLQERIRSFQHRQIVGQKKSMVQSSRGPTSQPLVRREVKEPAKSTVRSPSFFVQRENPRAATSGLFFNVNYQPKPPLNFFQQQKPQTPQIQGSQKPSFQSNQSQSRQLSKINHNPNARMKQQQIQKAQEQRAFSTVANRAKQPPQQLMSHAGRHQAAQKTQQQVQQRTQQQAQQRVQQQAAQQRAQQQQAQQRAQQQAQQRAQQQAQQRAQQQVQQRAQQQAQQRAQQQAQQRAQQQAQQRAQQQAQQQAQQRAQQQVAQQRAQQQAQQRAQQQAAQRAQQQAQQRAAQQAQQRSYQRK